MANELIQINNLKDNSFEFDLVAEGVNANDIKAKLVIEAKGLELGFQAQRNADGKWQVSVPPLPMLERTAYPFHVQVVAEGYHFRPMTGTLNVVGSAEIYVHNAQTKIGTPLVEQKKPVAKEVAPPPKALPAKGREKSIEQLATELMEANRVTKPIATAKHEKVTASTTDVEPTPEIQTEPASFFPHLETERSVEKRGSKDDVALRILEEAGYKPARKSHKRFSLKDVINE